MGEKYIPRIGDVIIDDDNVSYVVMDMKNHEKAYPGEERYYYRDYYYY